MKIDENNSKQACAQKAREYVPEDFENILKSPSCHSFTKEQIESALKFCCKENFQLKSEKYFLIEELKSLHQIYSHFNEKTALGVIRRFDNAIKSRNDVQNAVYNALSLSVRRKNRNKKHNNNIKSILDDDYSEVDNEKP